VDHSIMFLILGLIVGVSLTAVIVWLAMPKMMLVTHKSRYQSVEETCQQLKAAVEANGWSCPAIRDMNMTISQKGIQMDRRVMIVELCKAQYAKDVLSTNPEVSTLMPCAWGVYQGNNKNIYITGMNMSLMGKMFGGNIARIMGGSVAVDEKQMLKNVIKK